MVDTTIPMTDTNVQITITNDIVNISTIFHYNNIRLYTISRKRKDPSTTKKNRKIYLVILILGKFLIKAVYAKFFFSNPTTCKCRSSEINKFYEIYFFSSGYVLKFSCYQYCFPSVFDTIMKVTCNVKYRIVSSDVHCLPRRCQK